MLKFVRVQVDLKNKFKLEVVALNASLAASGSVSGSGRLAVKPDPGQRDMRLSH